MAKICGRGRSASVSEVGEASGCKAGAIVFNELRRRRPARARTGLTLYVAFLRPTFLG
jgi:hypothetical protein